MSATAFEVTVPTSTRDLAVEQRKTEELAATLRGYAIASAEEYSLADEMLSEVARRKAAVVGMRKEATGPLYGVIRTVEGWFRPYVGALESCEASIKSAMGAYRVALEKREREARELAAQAAESGNAGELVAALTVASEAAAKPDARATTTFLWRVKDCDVSAMSREWLIPNVGALDKFARMHKGDAPPVVPGVTFERTAQIGARK